MDINPRAEYERRLEIRKARRAVFEGRHRIVGYFKLAVVAVGVALAFTRPVWVSLAVAGYVVLAVVHDRVLRSRDRHSRAASYYERGLRRLDNDWVGKGEPGHRFADPSHPCAFDLDLFGAGSLFELLCTARTQAGEERLADWLRNPAPAEEILERQAAVEEVRPRVDFREDLAVLGEELRSAAVSEAFARWGEGRPFLPARGIRVALAIWAVAGVGAFVAWGVWGIRLPALIVLLLDLGLLMTSRRRVEEAIESAREAVSGLALFGKVLARLEREPFETPRLARLRAELGRKGAPPSVLIARLGRRMDFLDSRANFLVQAIDPVVLWSLQSICAVEAWRRDYGREARRWLEAVAEAEALTSLAGYAYEHPGDPFPEFSDGSPCFDAERLAHPLLPEDRAVRNDVRLGGESRALIISGSNMSGKSTLLRAVGTNAILAQCGAPVRAARLRMSPLAVGASIRVVDSIHSGTSRFYAEIRQIRQVVELTAGAHPVLFLLDELLQNTNSHDRRIGAEAILRLLVRGNAVGLLTTQDLALTEIANEPGSRAANVHFEDQLVDGTLRFDYRLRPGVVSRSNALDLMRSVGLEV